jgi:L-alanine-DL-glutamate epimerase-like enolase superfamily enzyme
MIQEGVRAYYLDGWYQDVVTTLPLVDHGFVSAPDGPGLGTRLRPDFLSRPDVEVVVHA